MSFIGLRVALVGPLPPPSGGMANQTLQLAGLLLASGASVEIVQVNPPFPRWVVRRRGLRALVRLFPYLLRLWRCDADLFHVMANSGWSWHLYAAPAIWIARLRGRRVVVNYRGGEAAAFMQRSGRLAGFSLRRADALLVPSPFLARIFGEHGHQPQIVPNIVDLELFAPRPHMRGNGPVLMVARNLEAIYDNASALRAFARIRDAFPAATLILAGTGPERAPLERLARELGVFDAVQFAGAVANAGMPALYQRTDLVLNPSLADNMPISVLEALACGVPVVSTDVGGLPDLLQHGVSGVLVPPRDPGAMAQAAVSLLRDAVRMQRLSRAGLRLAAGFGWTVVGPQLAAHYRRVLRAPRPGLAARVVAALLFPLHERLKRHHSVALRRQMEASQWWPAQRLRELQLERLRGLLAHAGEQVPYYRALFARTGFDPSLCATLADLARLPVLGKDDIRAQRDAFRSDLAGPLARFNTGGSSGEPLVFYIGRDRVSHDVAAKWRATRWWGVDVGSRELVVWGSPIELKAQDWVRALRDRLLRTSLLPAFEMSTRKLDQFVARIARERPAMLFGYPSALSLIARHAQARRVALDACGVQVVFVTSERLYDEQRALIASTFGCRVANGYGGRDAGFIAHECPAGSMHITAEDVVVEIVDPQGQPVADGQAGEIVVTHLATHDFPFIRYATGDIGVLDSRPCACGRGLPVLDQIQGRSTDFLRAQDGTVMHGLALIYILRDLPQVRAFKIIQESLDQTRVLVVAVPALGTTLRQDIDAKFKARLGAGVMVVIEEVGAIEPDPSGKFRYVISKVASS